MNLMLKTSGILLSSLLLAACGSSSDDHADEHDHEVSVLISQSTDYEGLSMLEEGETHNLPGSALSYSAELLLANNGEFAAALEGGAVEFVDGHHEEVISVDGLDSNVSKVINTNAHFSILVDGATQLVSYDVLEEHETTTPLTDELSLSITEYYPALVLEEGNELVSVVFNGTDAVIYEDTTATSDTTSCVDVDSTAQSAEFALVSCDDASFSVKLEEGVSDHTIEIDPIADIATAVTWLTRAGVFVGLGADDKFYVVEENDQEALVVLDGDVVNVKGFNAPANMCAWGIDSEAADIFALTANTLTVYDHEGGVADTISLDNSTRSTCADLRMAAASQAVLVVDNAAQVVYEIDKEADVYHVHGKEDLGVNDVESMLIFHEVGEVAGDHDH